MAKLFLMLNYSDKSHALFGDFSTLPFSKFKSNYIDKQKWLSPNLRLAFGEGWIITVKNKLDDLQKAMKLSNIPFRAVDRKSF